MALKRGYIEEDRGDIQSSRHEQHAKESLGKVADDAGEVRRQQEQCIDDDEKENLIGDLNSALASQWVCSVRSTFWEEGCSFRKREMWGKQKIVHEI